MMYTFQQAADAARLCIQEITERGKSKSSMEFDSMDANDNNASGLDERKILLKTGESCWASIFIEFGMTDFLFLMQLS